MGIRKEEQKQSSQWISLRNLGGGLNTFTDSQDLKDNEFSDLLNVTFDKGYPTPRKGSQLKWLAPTGETNAGLNLFAARASDGTNYAVACYAPNFYLRDEVNDQWVKINSTYTPTATNKALPYGYTNWNAGVSADVLYAGNGTNNSIRWPIAVGYVSTLASAGATSLVLSDATKFPSASPTLGTVTMTIASPAVATFASHGFAAGDIVYFSTTGALPTGVTAHTPYYVLATDLSTNTFKFSTSAGGTAVTTTGSQSGTHSIYRNVLVLKTAGGSEIYTTYSVKTSNTLTVPALLSNIAAGTCVTFQIAQSSAVQKGKIFSKFLGRLIVANQLGGECALYGSTVGNPESFTPATTSVGAFSQVITDGAGGIQGVDSFGEYLIVEKEDSLHKVILTTQQDTAGTSFKRLDILPVVTDISMGPVQPWARIKKNNFIYYATATEGILGINPDVTGSQMSVKTSILSQAIQPTVKSLDFSDTRTASYNQKILWTAKNKVTSDTLVVYDLLRENWTKFNGWLVKDWLGHNKKLYFLSASDNNIYEAFTDTKMDGENSYEAYCISKNFDLGNAALPKTTRKLFLSGYISAAETLKFDVVLTTGSKIINIPYQIKGNGKFTVANIPKALAMWVLGLFGLGLVSYENNPTTGYFRVYLSIPLRYGFYTVGVKTYSSVNGTDWGLTGYGFTSFLEQKSPEQMVIGAVGDETNIE